jgi:multiple sugar transport system permease protein
MKRGLFYRFSLPSNLMMIVLMLFPLMVAVWLSMHFVTFRNIANPEAVGLQNYIFILQDPLFWQAVRFSLVIIVVTVPIQIGLGFFMALMLDQISTMARGIYMSLMLLPFIVVPVVGTLMFKQQFEVGGLMAYAWRAISGEPFVFTETSVKALIVTHLIWYVTPYPMVVFFAGLQGLSQEQLEAATVDGANRFQQLRYIVVPYLKPLFLMTSMILVMDMYRMFDSLMVMTEQNPIYNAENLMMYNFRVGMKVQRLGRANATAVLTVLGVLVVLIPFLRQTYRAQTGKD